MSNGVKIGFNLDGSFREISGSSNNGGGDDSDDEGQEINPSSLLQVIKDYLAANYPGVDIDEAEIYDWGYEVKLDNGVKLKFNLDGTRRS